MPRLLLRLLAGVHLVAFVSLWVQIDGLVGSRGILPARDFFVYLERVLGAGALDRFVNVPSLLWLGSGDAALHALCAAGVLLSLLAIAGLVTAPVFAALWICYLSLVWGGQTFLAFQWDTLLLEATLCAVVLAPLGWPFRGPDDAPAGAEPRRLTAAVRAAFQAAPSPAAARPGMWLFRLLVVKLMFLSGAVKLLSMDSTWWQLTALDVHYFTQPLPVAASWYAHHLPEWFHRLSVLVMFAVELAAPWFVFFRRLRLPGMGVLLLLQFLIAATGNYGFFNLLTAVLCLSWLGAGTVGGWRRTSGLQAAAAGGGGRPQVKPGIRVRWAVATVILLLSLLTSMRELTRSLPRGPGTPPAAAATADFIGRVLVDPAAPLLGVIAPFRSINGYGLFRAMTTSRPEIVVETSADGAAWSELAFRFKPGDLNRPPRAAFPHMPRLDWQMWFAALDPAGADWLGSFVERLFEGEPAVLWLLGEAARPAEPPRYVRLRLYDYAFSEPRTGAPWWQREFLYDLSPVLAREAFAQDPVDGGAR
ncbi:MAG: lipase maturation factor family protein [Acidobacteria bacterium]|nr:lipase maturation factor family protein [Acidobacteriota bacterium]